MGVVTPGLVVLGPLVPFGTKPTTNQRAGSLLPRQTRARRGRRAELCNQLVALLVLIGLHSHPPPPPQQQQPVTDMKRGRRSVALPHQRKSVPASPQQRTHPDMMPESQHLAPTDRWDYPIDESRRAKRKRPRRIQRPQYPFGGLLLLMRRRIPSSSRCSCWLPLCRVGLLFSVFHVILWLIGPSKSFAWTVPSNKFVVIRRSEPPTVSAWWMSSSPPPSSSSSVVIMLARRNRQSDSSDSLESWYDPVDASATPDEVFWEEMERQNSLIGNSAAPTTAPAGGASSSSGEPQDFSSIPADALFPSALPMNRGALFASTGNTVSSASWSTASSASSLPMQQQQQQQQQQSSSLPLGSFFAGSSNMGSSRVGTLGGGGGGGGGATDGKTILTPKSVEMALARYGSFQVADNWLNEDIIALLVQQQGLTGRSEEDFYKGVPSLDEQLDEWASEDEENDSKAAGTRGWVAPPDDPWDRWGQSQNGDTDDDDDDDDDDMDEDSGERIRIEKDDPRRQPSEFLFDQDQEAAKSDDTDKDPDTFSTYDDEREEAEYLARLSKITVISPRLERARGNPKAAAFFQREPNETEGFDRMWVSAIDNVCFKNLVGTFRNYGIQFCDNFGDWEDCSASDNFVSIEDIASRKARQVFEVTGLPCIASRTSFEIEPVPDLGKSENSASSGGSSRPSVAAAAILNNPRVRSGYRFNDVGMHVDYLCDTLQPISEPNRVTSFKTCLCYYDGEMEIFDYGICDVDLHFANSLRTFIPVAQAINEMMKTLELTFGLTYQPWLRKRQEDLLLGRFAVAGRASIKLRDRVLKEGKVLPNDIIDVSAFMDSMVDVNLMDECAKELSERFIQEKPSKILTVATTGLVIALPMAKYLQVPVVYARKERNVVMADTYIAAYSSKTVGKNRELLVSKSHLDEDDRVLIVDDFLSSGASQEALLRIIFDAHATAVGVGVLLEKVYDSGRQSLSGFDVPVHSLCRIASVQSGVIQLVEEEGFDLMQKEREMRSMGNAKNSLK